MNSQKIAPIARHIIPPILNIWIKKIKGLENLPKTKSFIITPNHSSYIEHLMLGCILIPYLNRKIHFIAKKEHFKSITQNSWHRFWSKYIGYIQIDRSKGEKALEESEKLLKKGAVIIMYPEGTRTLNGKIQKGKTGVARLALLSHVPIVPLGIVGTFEILPKGKKLPRMKKAILKFGKPIYFNKYYHKPIAKKLLREITDKVMKEIAKLSNQKYNF